MINIKGFRSIQTKLILYFVILVFIITLLTGIVQYKVSSERLLEHTKEEVSKLAVAASLLIDGDSHQKLTRPQDQSSSMYEEIRNQIQGFQKETEVACVYTLVESEDNKTKFIVDAEEEDPAPIGYEYDYLPAMKLAFKGTKSADKEMYTDEWGTVLSGYAPIKDGQGEVVAIVGVDIDASDVLKQKNQLIIGTAISIIFSIILTLILSIFLSRKIVKPIRFLAERFKELSSSGGI